VLLKEAQAMCGRTQQNQTKNNRTLAYPITRPVGGAMFLTGDKMLFRGLCVLRSDSNS